MDREVSKMKKLLATQELGPITGIGGYDPNTDAGISGYTSAAEKVISNALAIITITAGVMFMIFFLIGAINWITAGGDEGKVKKAQQFMTGAAIGLIIIGLSYSLSYIIGTVLGYEILNPAKVINNLKF